MNVLSELRARFAAVLAEYSPEAAALSDQVRRSQDAKFGDYQANCAMPLSKLLGKPARDVAAELASKVKVDDLCSAVEIAGPGFINLKLRDDWLADTVAAAVGDPARLGIAPVAKPGVYVVDFSSPNVAKPLHVGHIRSTVIGDALCRTLRFAGHTVISDNHVGDWGTQFGMILWGYKHAVDRPAYESSPVEELGRLYKLVSQLVSYHESRAQLAAVKQRLEKTTAEAERLQKTTAPSDKAAAKEHRLALSAAQSKRAEAAETLAGMEQRIAAVEGDATLKALADQYPDIGKEVLAETARLHAGDEFNRRLWEEFLPPCLKMIEETVYQRLGVTFDHTLGESFYHNQLAAVVESLRARGIAEPGEGGSVCVFDPRFPAPMLIQKQDGAFLYATTDLATINYRVDNWRPDVVLYVVDHRQSLHFEQLFAAAKRWGYDQLQLVHVSFGTVLGADGKPYKTREGTAAGLSGLLDEGVRRALDVVSKKDDEKRDGPELSPDERQEVAETVGIGALKYADLSQNRTTDYEFSYEKMLALDGNTAAYMQYMYARVQSIFRRGKIDIAAVRSFSAAISLSEPAERALAVALLKFHEAIEATLADYRPNQLTTYLFELAQVYSQFFDKCPVLKAETPQLRDSRLLLCDLTARTIAKGLELLGIGVVEKM